MTIGEQVSVGAETRTRTNNRGLASTAPFSPGFLAGMVGLVDFCAFVVAGALARAFGGDAGAFADSQFIGAVGLFSVVSILTFRSAGLYRFLAIVRPVREWPKICSVLVMVFMAMTALAFLFKISGDFRRSQVLMWLATSIVFVIGLRWIVAVSFRALANSGRLRRRILIYGANEQARRLIEQIEALNEPWNQIIGIFDDRQSRVGPKVSGYPVLGNLRDLVTWGRSGGPDEILVAMPWSAEQRVLSILSTLAVLPVNIRLCPESFNRAIVGGRSSRQYGIPMINALERPLNGWGAVGKRIFDLLFSTAVLAAAAPFMLLVVALIKLESPGPALFRQKRYGFNNDVIEVYKFRTMAEADSNPGANRFTARGDPRITRVGKLLRRSSLDELPQVLNVLRGEMSIIGPRPHALHTTAGGRLCEQVIDRYSARHKVKPGITGWAQVNGFRGTMEDEEHLQKRVEHDLHYISNWSALLDLKILAMTAWIVVVGRNSY